MEWISSAQRNGGTSITTMPTHAAGDILLISAMRFSSTTIPSLPSGWTSILTGSGSGRGWRVGYKVAASASETSGTWANATDVNLSVYRGVDSVGAVAASTSGVPALTLTEPGVGWVAVQEVDYPEPPTPDDCVLRDRGDWWRFSDTDGPVGSWAAQTTPARTASIAVSVELIPTDTPVGGSYSPAWDVEAYAGGSYSPAWDVAELTAAGSYSPAWDVEAYAGGSYSPAWDVLARGSWRDVARSAAFVRAVESPRRMVSAWGGLVDPLGNPAPVVVGRRPATWALPLRRASVAMYGERAESWDATLEFTDRWMVPTRPDHPFWGLSNYRIRLYWRILSDEGWLETVVCTVVPEDPDTTDDGLVSTTVSGRDVLSTARGGYGAGLDVSGMTYDAAIRAIFERVAPTLQVRVAPTLLTAPDPCVLGDRNPAEDWTDFAAAAWPDGVVRSDREGIVYAGPRPTPGETLDWQRVPAQFKRRLKTSAMGNRLTVRSTHPDAAGLSVTVQDDNPASPTWVGGDWGVHPLPSVDSDVAVSAEALENVGWMHLGKGLHPTEDVEVTVPQRFDLDYQRPALLARDGLGIGGVYRVASWGPTDLPIGTDAPARMPVRLMQRTVR